MDETWQSSVLKLRGIAFNLMYEQVLRKIRTAGEKHGIWNEQTIMYHPAQPPWNVCLLKQRHVLMNSPCMTPETGSHATLADVTFVDDACFSFEADNPVSLVNSATMLLQIVDETCEAHGLLVNMNDGKTHKDRAKVRELCHDTNMLGRSKPGHKIRETMPKRKQTMHSQRTTNWLTLCHSAQRQGCVWAHEGPRQNRHLPFWLKVPVPGKFFLQGISELKSGCFSQSLYQSLTPCCQDIRPTR